MDKKTLRHPHLDKIRGRLIGGAIGDALGYPVEFMSREAIQKKYGADGIQSYELDFETGAAVFSDDTQMSLFTANGILIGETQWHLKGIQGSIAGYVHIAYEEWLKTQQGADPHRPIIGAGCLRFRSCIVTALRAQPVCQP